MCQNMPPTYNKDFNHMAQKKSAQSTIISEKSNGLVIVDAYVKKKHNETTKMVEASNRVVASLVARYIDARV